MTAKVITQEQIIQRVREIINRQCYLIYNEKNDTYKGDIYADYNDELEDRTIEEIFESDNPREKLYEMISDWYMECEGDYLDEVINTIKNNFDDEDNGIFYEDFENTIRDWVYEHVYFNYPYKHFFESICRSRYNR